MIYMMIKAVDKPGAYRAVPAAVALSPASRAESEARSGIECVEKLY